ncbi:DUF262 and DUF1524 domain-containing protein [Helicobacter turcicus]|uniref:DUF262 and DUF1524 domain-containing protein n=1 Tax=Helicobacter turcicus TaxID=2867412 RepID=A0ABS7JLV4_9HELI|nr:DUF262 and DUF1524 domain-containing protein [Helicobacter turcicus]MBX7490381.1 DUF262 and DUF1524 domain-containing protein [Helicobacter turcicus]MBX7545040.1 DUF262 and DUF1524 domain-containing protein [Helicobacter turcicus]
MEAKAVKMLDFMHEPKTQFIIPIYQRTYSWDEEQCEKLWQDIWQIGTNEKKAHFIGSVIYIHENTYHHSSINQLLVIDGQQRITTLTLLLEALREIIDDEIEGFSQAEIRDYYLINQYGKNEEKYKLILTQNDKDTLISLIDNDKAKPKEISSKIQANFDFFKEKLEKNKDKLETICKGISKLLIIDVALERGKDDPQLIFESMNSTGKKLSQSDLIRNYMLMDLPPDKQSRFYEKYWRVMELEFGENFNKTKQNKPDKQSFDYFVRHYLTIKNEGNITNLDKIYDDFKEYRQNQGITREDLLVDLQIYAHFYCTMAFGKEGDKELKSSFKNLKALDCEVAYPLLLELYRDYTENTLSKNDFLEILKLIESYVLRRAVCGIPTSALNKTFASFAKNIKKDQYLESLKAYFSLQKSNTIFPNDTKFHDALINKDDFYKFSKKSYFFDRLENLDRKERVSINGYTFEHIMPQNIDNSTEWQKELGENWQEIHEKYLNTLGNLTLTGYNSEYSNKPFKEKQNTKGGFKESPLRLNQGLKNIESWNEQAIKQRAEELAKDALKIWLYPKVDKEILENYKPKKEKQTYTLRDHKPLQSGKTKELFEALRREIFALDENIEEEILKRYIAYKLDTNFVNIIPLQKELKLSINIYLDELDDPRGLARDVSNIGKWGNGNVEVRLDSMEDLPYCLGLIRQALEKQEYN